jgi:hypothetical protein
MGAATVVRQMSEIPDIPAPERESHAAALAQLKDPDQQRQAWEAALQRAQDLGKRITAALVEAVVREMVAPPAPPASADSSGEEPAPAQQQVVIDQADDNGMFPDDAPAAAAPATSPATAPAQGDWLHLAVQADEEEVATKLSTSSSRLSRTWCSSAWWPIPARIWSRS